MTLVPLRLGPLAAPGFMVQRSGIRWLREDGYVCRPGEVVALCNIGLAPLAGTLGANPFADEWFDFQVAFAPRHGGVISRLAGSSRGGFLDQQHYHFAWDPDFAIGHLDSPAGENPAGAPSVPELRLLMLAGRRMSKFAEVRTGLLSGWYERSRAWWGEGDADPGTVIGMGICEVAAILRGERSAFLELFEAVPGPVQLVMIQDEPLVPCAAVVAEQLRRSAAQSEAIAADLARSFTAGPVVPTPADWIFAGALLTALQRSPLTDAYTLLTRSGLRHTRPADAVILSLAAEGGTLWRHRRLGYAVKLYAFRIDDAGPGARAWLRENFTAIRQTTDEIRADYLALIHAIRERSAMKIVVLNQLSSSGREDITSYVPFDRPMSETLASIRAKELDLMLHDMARAHGIAIIDVDALAAEMGAMSHMPDGFHQSGRLQREVRREILRVLGEQGIPGFGGAAAPG